MAFGKVMWTDLTVPNTEAVRDFYQAVAGWTVQEVNMGDYADYSMLDSEGAGAAGVCHPLGENSGLPPQWLIYITVEDMDASIAACKQHGGSVIHGPRDMGGGSFCVVRDPAGAVAGLIEMGEMPPEA